MEEVVVLPAATDTKDVHCVGPPGDVDQGEGSTVQVYVGMDIRVLTGGVYILDVVSMDKTVEITEDALKLALFVHIIIMKHD